MVAMAMRARINNDLFILWYLKLKNCLVGDIEYYQEIQRRRTKSLLSEKRRLGSKDTWEGNSYREIKVTSKIRNMQAGLRKYRKFLLIN